MQGRKEEEKELQGIMAAAPRAQRVALESGVLGSHGEGEAYAREERVDQESILEMLRRDVRA